MNERDQVERAKQGDIEARNELIEDNVEAINRHVARGADRDSPLMRQQYDDVAQETWRVALGAFGRYQGASSFKTYLKGIADKVRIGLWRQEQRQVRGTGGEADAVADVPDRLPAPIDDLIGKERTHLVTRAVEGLPGDQREAVRRFMDGESYHAIVMSLSRRLGVTKYRAGQKFANALDSLAHELPDDL
jgi:RNA polymerase sigma factor (sigma-70 family)